MEGVIGIDAAVLNIKTDEDLIEDQIICFMQGIRL